MSQRLAFCVRRLMLATAGARQRQAAGLLICRLDELGVSDAEALRVLDELADRLEAGRPIMPAAIVACADEFERP